MSNEFFEEFMSDPYFNETGGGGDFKTIARAMVQPAYQGWQFGANPKVFPYNGSKEAGAVARAECEEYCQGEKSFPQAGMLTTIYGGDMPTHPEGAMDNDWLDFQPVFHSRDKYTGKVDVQGDFPYDLVIAGLKANPSVFNQVQWCELSRPIDNVREPRRKKEKSKYAHRVYVVEKVFKNREEAYKAAGKEDEGNVDEFAGFAGFDDKLQLSAKAQGPGNWTMKLWKSQDQVIYSMILDACLGKNTPNNESLVLKDACQLVCENVSVELSDLRFLPGAVHNMIKDASERVNTPNNEKLSINQARQFVCDQIGIELDDLNLLETEAPF